MTAQLDRKTALEVVSGCVREALELAGAESADVTENTVLVGPGAVLDSIGVVSLIVDVEQRLEMEHAVSVTLASDKAMSQRNSPFRTAGVLADHVLEVMREGAAS